ncbi:MAG TPA: anthranilate synthase component I family protein [Acidimicrobiia bacterium]|nr:anthranilate synthase component I family protein [Acidimicrobiia bacterium]
MHLPDAVAAALLGRLPRDVGAAAVRRGGSTIVGVAPDEVAVGTGAEALARLESLTPGLWVGWCAFELGHALERVVPRGASLEPPSVPDLAFARFGATARVTPDGVITVTGEGSGRDLLERAAVMVEVRRDADTPMPGGDPRGWRSSLDRDGFEHRVAAVLDLLRAGECYQVNLTRRLVHDSPHDAVAIYSALAASHAAPHTGLFRLELPGGPVAVVCASPERYLSWRGRTVETQPIKGTATDAGELGRSAKDRAENVMIVDLARNDLGRVCEPGSIGVPTLCAVESHPGLHHLVSVVRGTLRPDVGIGTLVGATFPPASVTGAPKPRVLQAIEDLETVRRGVYCGAFGWIDTACGDADLAVAIRTFTVYPHHTELGVGAGIVADSSPPSEWFETELKASRLLLVARAAELLPS